LSVSFFRKFHQGEKEKLLLGGLKYGVALIPQLDSLLSGN
jgi:hypothetical protein